jgi:hypothetical protein
MIPTDLDEGIVTTIYIREDAILVFEVTERGPLGSRRGSGGCCCWGCGAERLEDPAPKGNPSPHVVDKKQLLFTIASNRSSNICIEC